MNSEQNFNQRQQGQWNRNKVNQSYQSNNNNNDDNYGNQANQRNQNRPFSPNKQRFQKQNFQGNNNNSGDNNDGGVQNRNRNPRFQQGQRNQNQQQDGQQNSRSITPNSRFPRGNGSSGDWQQQRNQFNNQTNQNNNRIQNSQKERSQNSNNSTSQNRGTNRISNAVKSNAQANTQSFNANKNRGQQQYNKFQPNSQIKNYSQPPRPNRIKEQQQQGNEQSNSIVRELVVNRNPKKNPSVPKEMKEFINNNEEEEEEQSQYSNSEEQEEQEGDDYTEEQDNDIDDNDNEDKSDYSDQGSDYNSQKNSQEEEEEQSNYDNDDEVDRSDNLDSNSEEQDNDKDESNKESDDRDIIPDQAGSNKPVRELLVRRVGNKQQDIVGVDSEVVDSTPSNYLNQNNLNVNSFDGNQIELLEQKKKLESMCHETINDSSWEWHLANGRKQFAFFEKNKQGEPQKHLSMKIHYRSAAAKELSLCDILSPIGIKKSTDRMINEILDYFLSPSVNVKNLVFNFTNRLRTLTTELEPLSEHLSLFNSSKMMIEIKEQLLAIHLGGINYFRQQSCLQDTELENGYSEKKHFEQLQTLTDTLFSIYEVNIEKVQNIIKNNKSMSMEALKQKILENENVYISPLIPKVMAWRMLIRLDQYESLHKMDNLMYITYDSLITDQSFCAIFEMIVWLAKKNYHKYFDLLNNDKRIDYLTANAALVYLAKTRLNYILQEREVTLSTMKNLNFNLKSDYDRESADFFLKKLNSSLEDLERDAKVRIDHNNAGNISLKQNYWPNFYEQIEWRKPQTFKQTIRQIFQEIENNRFAETLVENMIRKERNLPTLVQKQVKSTMPARVIQEVVKPIAFEPEKKSKPTMNFSAIMKKPVLPVIDQAALQQKMIEETQKISIEEERKKREEEKRMKIIFKWKDLIDSSFAIEKNKVINQICNTLETVRYEEFHESYIQYKYFNYWKTKFLQYKSKKYQDQYRNQQKIHHGINNKNIVIESNQAFSKASQIASKESNMELESDSSIRDDQQNHLNQGSHAQDKTQFYKQFLKAFQEKEKLIQPYEQSFLDTLSINFLKQNNKMFTHVYYKITIVSDESNPLIEKQLNNLLLKQIKNKKKMVKSFSSYLSQGNIKADQNTFNIVISVEDITIEYTLQLQMAKYLDTISSKELSGTDLFIYIFNEQDDGLNQQYYSNFKSHLKNLSENKLFSGFNMLFLSVSEINKSLEQNKPVQYFSKIIKSQPASQNKTQKSDSASKVDIFSQVNKSMNQYSNHSNSAHQMMLEMDYTNPEVQDSEGQVRRAIKYLNSRFDLKRDVKDNSLYQYYNVVSYNYEIFNKKCINENPFSELIFKTSVDSAIEKSVRIKNPFGKITLSSLTIELSKIRSILTFGNKQFGANRSNSIPNFVNGLPPLPNSSSGHSLYKNLKEFLSRENVLDTNKYSDMKNYFYFKYLFNNTIFQLFENFLNILEQSHLIPFDQLSEFEISHLLLLEKTHDIVKEQLDRIFLHGSNKLLRSQIRQNYLTSFSYENVVQVIDNYYKVLLEIETPSSERSLNSPLDCSTNDSMSSNYEAFLNLQKEMVGVVKTNFTFEQNREQGVVGNWQAIFIKLIDQLIFIFSDNDIPLFLSQNFQFKFDCKAMKKNVSLEYNKMNEWLRDLKKANDDYLQKRSQSIYDDDNIYSNFKPSKKRHTEKQKPIQKSSFCESPQHIINLYSDIIQYNNKSFVNSQPLQNGVKDSEELSLKKRQSNGNINKKTVQIHSSNQNEVPMKIDQKQSSLSYSSSEDSSISENEDSSISQESVEQTNTKNNKQNIDNDDNNDQQQSNRNKVDPNNFKKRRTACLILNSKDDIQDNLQYNERIKQLMRGEMANSPTYLDDSFV